jgi:hypothetical protein
LTNPISNHAPTKIHALKLFQMAGSDGAKNWKYYVEKCSKG